MAQPPVLMFCNKRGVKMEVCETKNQEKKNNTNNNNNNNNKDLPKENYSSKQTMDSFALWQTRGKAGKCSLVPRAQGQ